MSGETCTILRDRYERSRDLDLATQMRDCVDYLENPDVLISELLESFAAIESLVAECPFAPWAPEAGSEDDIVLEDFGAGVDVTVEGGERFHFRCLDPWAAPLPVPRDDEANIRCGLDYIAWVAEPHGVPALGIVTSEHDDSAYLALLRGLVCLSELAPVAQLSQLDETLFKGNLPERPTVDLHLVVHEASGEAACEDPLFQLTRDLAERMKSELGAAPQFPNVLRGIACFVLPPGPFEGTLRFAWRV